MNTKFDEQFTSVFGSGQVTGGGLRRGEYETVNAVTSPSKQQHKGQAPSLANKLKANHP